MDIHVIEYCTETEKQGLCGYKMDISVSVNEPCYVMAHWELWLAATAQHLKRVSYEISLAWEEIKLKIQSRVSTEYVSLLHHHKIEES